MTHQERDRLAISLVISLVIHAGIVAGLGFADWDLQAYPEPTPVYVELLEYSTAPLPEETPTTPEPVAQPEPEPQPEISEPEIASAPQTPSPPVQTNQSAPTTPAPAPAASTQAAATPQPSVGRDYQPGDLASDNTGLVTESNVERHRPSDTAELFTVPDAWSTGELPAWVAEGPIQPLDSLPPADQAALEAKTDSIAGLEQRLDDILAALANADAAAPASSIVPPGETTTTGVNLPENTSLDWLGGGARRPRGTLRLPEYTGADFGPEGFSRIQYVIVFDVNADGRVVPGSLILRQSSGYTLADQRMLEAVSAWAFDLAPLAPNVTAICTVIIERDDLP